jgi:hypothetical protein
MSAIVYNCADAREWLLTEYKKRTESTAPHQIEMELISLNLLTVRAHERLLLARGKERESETSK